MLNRKRTYDDDVVTTAPKRHCASCLNTNLIDVKAVADIVDVMLKSCCHVCGMLWVRVDNRQTHEDEHVREAVEWKTKMIRANQTSIRRSDQMAEAAAHKNLIYHMDRKTAASEIDKRLTKFASSFSKMSDQQKKYFKDIARATINADRAIFDGTALEGDVDDRPTIDLFNLRHPIHTAVSGNHLELAEFLSVDYCTRVWTDKSSVHVTYQTDLPLDTEDWGCQDYVCHACSEILPLSLDDDQGVGPVLSNSRVCSCTSSEEHHHDPTKMTQTVVPTDVDRRYYLFVSTSMYNGYVVHNTCCSMYYKNVKINA